uniref:PHD-type domain-containing protein n=1 Tax=Compsopogon caeruleus TaxID=31354 RepID=A0A7S1XG86_9RHOD|mmetsp:Transcript_5124/g.10397  ORF Transcript_5124/g.10397 Transcript_5124/m.10397 type:complete len:881 (+) Transcript_5124:96-2738(+)
MTRRSVRRGGAWPQVGVSIDVLGSDGVWEGGHVVGRRYSAVKRDQMPLIPAMCVVKGRAERLSFADIRPSIISAGSEATSGLEDARLKGGRRLSEPALRTGNVDDVDLDDRVKDEMCEDAISGHEKRVKGREKPSSGEAPETDEDGAGPSDLPQPGTHSSPGKSDPLYGAKVVKCVRTKGLICNVCEKTSRAHVVYETNEDADVELKRAELLTLEAGKRKPPAQCLFESDQTDHPLDPPPRRPSYYDNDLFVVGDTVTVAWDDLKEYRGRIRSVKKSASYCDVDALDNSWRVVNLTFARVRKVADSGKSDEIHPLVTGILHGYRHLVGRVVVEKREWCQVAWEDDTQESISSDTIRKAMDSSCFDFAPEDLDDEETASTDSLRHWKLTSQKPTTSTVQRASKRRRSEGEKPLQEDRPAKGERLTKKSSSTTTVVEGAMKEGTGTRLTEAVASSRSVKTKALRSTSEAEAEVMSSLIGERPGDSRKIGKSLTMKDDSSKPKASEGYSKRETTSNPPKRESSAPSAVTDGVSLMGSIPDIAKRRVTTATPLLFRSSEESTTGKQDQLQQPKRCDACRDANHASFMLNCTNSGCSATWHLYCLPACPTSTSVNDFLCSMCSSTHDDSLPIDVRSGDMLSGYQNEYLVSGTGWVQENRFTSTQLQQFWGARVTMKPFPSQLLLRGRGPILVAAGNEQDTSFQFLNGVEAGIRVLSGFLDLKIAEEVYQGLKSVSLDTPQVVKLLRKETIGHESEGSVIWYLAEVVEMMEKKELVQHNSISTVEPISSELTVKPQSLLAKGHTGPVSVIPFGGDLEVSLYSTSGTPFVENDGDIQVSQLTRLMVGVGSLVTLSEQAVESFFVGLSPVESAEHSPLVIFRSLGSAQ